MIDSHILPLEARLLQNSDPTVIQAVNDILLRYDEDMTDDEKEALRQAIVLMTAVQEAIRNRNGKRTRSLLVTERGQINFEALKPGTNIRLLSKGFSRDTNSESTAEGQEVILRRKDSSSVEVLIVDPTPLG